MIKQISADEIETHLDQLVDILCQTVSQDGAVGFVAPLGPIDAAAFWQKIIMPQLENGDRLMFVALEGEQIAGTGQLIVGMPNNQPHRAEISKLMVHPNFRRKGYAKRVMQVLERAAIEQGRSLITLDTRTGDGAEPLYTSLGYKVAGIIPQFAKNAVGDEFHATTYMYKLLK
ncbi:N-acetyltransferase family protein [Maritalea sp.]|uniref:GNAT family N-acetyltransferase n=1 Tax=Maritalea sp. TaxID=2003361 RepID=UPI003EF9B321